MGIKRCHVDFSSLVELDGKQFPCPVTFESVDNIIRFTVKLMKGNALVGVVPVNAFDESSVYMKYSADKAPEHGYFVNICANKEESSHLSLFGQDGTCNKPSLLSGEHDGIAMALRADTSASLLELVAASNWRANGTNVETDVKTLEFAQPLPNVVYEPCVLMDKNAKIMVLDYRERERKRRKTAPARTTVLATMWRDRDFTDATIVCQDQCFNVHSAVMSAASPVFSAAFSSGMVEGATKRLEIKDALPQAMEQLLHYMYNGFVDENLVSQILPLAVRYQVHPLAEQCGEICRERIFYSKTSDQVVVDLLGVLRKHKADNAIAKIWEGVISSTKNDDRIVRLLLENI